jgi:uncharacterized membrane protein YebE (DUF533 family)
MFSMARQRVFIAVFLMAVLFLGGAVAVQAADRDTGGSDRMVKGAAAGAAIGAVTQVVRGRRSGVELLKGAAVGASVGAAAGAYSDYKQEKSARQDAEREADYYASQSYRNNRGRAYRNNNRQNFNRQARANRGGHRHNGRCRH